MSIKQIRLRHTHYAALKVINRQIKNLELFLQSKEAETASQEDLEEINYRLSSLKQTFKFLTENDTNTRI